VRDNITVLSQWMASEEPASDWHNRNNPLNNGDGSGGGAGLGTYDNLVIAAYYAAHNINANPSWYGQIDSDLPACATATAEYTLAQTALITATTPTGRRCAAC
jgi:hypothetical protein